MSVEEPQDSYKTVPQERAARGMIDRVSVDIAIAIV